MSAPIRVGLQLLFSLVPLALGLPLRGDELIPDRIPGLVRSAIGVTRAGTAIPCFVSQHDVDVAADQRRVLLVGGLDGRRESTATVLAAVRWFYESAQAHELRKTWILSAVPAVNIDGLARSIGNQNGAGGDPSVGYPPRGDAYLSESNPEADYLWRWIGMHAPDLVVQVDSGEELRWFVPDAFAESLPELRQALASTTAQAVTADSLVVQLPQAAPCETGTVPAVRATIPVDASSMWVSTLLAAAETAGLGPSPARIEVRRRVGRNPLEIARELSLTYGHELEQVQYIAAMALVGRLWLGELDGDASHRADVEKIVAPYFQGDKPTQPDSGSALSGHLIFTELARTCPPAQRERYLELARGAADLGFDSQGKPLDAMPFHLEMSDSVFMGGPILAAVGRLRDDSRYFDACLLHTRFMRKLVARDDGLYRHSPLDETAWGRGNGFPALGLALCLSDFPEAHPGRPELLAAFQSHMKALARHQDYTGCWHQVIDRPESYREFTATCMITFALLRGVQRGWLERAEFEPLIDRGWYAIRTRIGPQGSLVDVCTGTGKQTDLRAYYDRTAILGRDARGGAMALLVTMERARWESPAGK